MRRQTAVGHLVEIAAMASEQLRYRDSDIGWPLEAKVFAPGYGEFYSGGGHDFEANALSVPADARPGSMPDELRLLMRRTHELIGKARSNQWKAAAARLNGITAAWNAFRARRVLDRLASHMRRELAALTSAVHARQGRAAVQRALHVADAALDLELQYLAPSAVNTARFVLWTRQLALDAHARRAGAVHGDVTTLGWIRDRLDLPLAAGRGIDDQIRLLRASRKPRNSGLRRRRPHGSATPSRQLPQLADDAHPETSLAVARAGDPRSQRSSPLDAAVDRSKRVGRIRRNRKK